MGHIFTTHPNNPRSWYSLSTSALDFRAASYLDSYVETSSSIPFLVKCTNMKVSRHIFDRYRYLQVYVMYESMYER